MRELLYRNFTLYYHLLVSNNVISYAHLPLTVRVLVSSSLFNVNNLKVGDPTLPTENSTTEHTITRERCEYISRTLSVAV